ncbi:hypothetical protein [Nocardia cyriacigeorgica]|uniref:hypothetical protein n=1 Tax=Nocardia cyriacigeorgica TaxID=135487 RepID=UPI001894CFE5|nr:hypothetical protein [Nocardia cyriacigeorgica]MBF6435977.1 hypothetical protein [Nocardia cyriacigeorgica]
MSTAISDMDRVASGPETGEAGLGLVPGAGGGVAAGRRQSRRGATEGGSGERGSVAVRVRPARGTLRTRQAIHRPAERRPRGAGPRAAVVRYDSRPARLARAGYPADSAQRVEQAQVGFAVLAIAAVLSALVVTALIGIAHLRAESVAPQQHPQGPAVVEPALLPGDVSADVPR